MKKQNCKKQLDKLKNKASNLTLKHALTRVKAAKAHLKFKKEEKKK